MSYLIGKIFSKSATTTNSYQGVPAVPVMSKQANINVALNKIKGAWIAIWESDGTNNATATSVRILPVEFWQSLMDKHLECNSLAEIHRAINDHNALRYSKDTVRVHYKVFSKITPDYDSRYGKCIVSGSDITMEMDGRATLTSYKNFNKGNYDVEFISLNSSVIDFYDASTEKTIAYESYIKTDIKHRIGEMAPEYFYDFIYKVKGHNVVMWKSNNGSLNSMPNEFWKYAADAKTSFTNESDAKRAVRNHQALCLDKCKIHYKVFINTNKPRYDKGSYTSTGILSYVSSYVSNGFFDKGNYDIEIICLGEDKSYFYDGITDRSRDQPNCIETVITYSIE